jgi:hypothetical protein
MRTQEEQELLPAYQKRLIPQTSLPGLTPPAQSGNRLEVSVVFTSIHATLSALRKAAEMANNLGARITLIVPQVVPYPLPLNSPPILIDFSERRFHVIASQIPAETVVRIYLCRDAWDALTQVLKPGSLVVVGSPKRWWPTKEKRLAAQLRKAGHEVVVTEVE